MQRPFQLFVIAAAAIAAAGHAAPPPSGTGDPAVAVAANPQTVSTTESAFPVHTQNSSPASDGTTHSMSSAISAAITEDLPKAAPQKAAAIPTFEAQAPSTESGDKEAPTVPKLPAFRVVGSHVFEVRDSEFYTRMGAIAATFNRHPGLLVGNIFGLNAKKAYEIFREDEWRVTMAEYRDMARAFETGGDPGEGQMILDAVIDQDIAFRAQGEQDESSPLSDRFKTPQTENNSRFLSGPEHPIDFPVVRVVW